VLHELAAIQENETSRDVWAVQDLRHRAGALLESDPVLREELAGELAKHPEIG